MAQYTVQAGDNLTKIAKRYNTTVTDLVKTNGIKDPNLIRIGESLLVPDSSPAAPAPTPAAPAAADRLAAYENMPPAEYQGRYDGNIQGLVDKILNTAPFEYDPKADPFARMYTNMYTNLGQTAMKDTIGNAAALTGGYASSAAATAGSQAYQGYLDQLNSILPSLYDAAYTRYRDDEARLYNQMGMLQGLDNTGYNRFLDKQNTDYRERDYWNGKVTDERNFNYQKSQDAKADSLYEKQLAMQQEQMNRPAGLSYTDKMALNDKAMEIYKQEGAAGLERYLGLQVASGFLTSEEAGQLYSVLEDLPGLSDPNAWKSNILSSAEFARRKQAGAAWRSH